MDATGYCVKCKGKRKFKHGHGKLGKTSNNRTVIQGPCDTCGTKMNRFVSKKDLVDGSGLLSMLGIPMPQSLQNIPLLGPLLF